ncbi:CU044_5270 family protein [Nonomuraea sp. SMC257]|uniref:CU044_5270 family protein n=1 Tax=Nonomuraea montanisoli TaxID=2741721 RepID=A0A7Y6IEW1_9ACTN|nr:CU044_5270 family protein [Nonomuraea montanisoli]NUW35499.1 CU044_5270 family protein [Nonomuraea montanisoli]
MTQLERFRAEVPQPGPARVRRHEERLLAAIARDAGGAPERGRRTPRLRLLGLAAGLAAAVTAGVVVVARPGAEAPQIIHPMPVAASEVLERAAEHASRAPELHPEPGQFLVFESRTMNPSYGTDRYLYRTWRKVWLPVRGDATGGVIDGENLPPEPFPGWPVPAEAYEGVGRRSGPEKLADFDDRVEYLRSDYDYVSRLPTEPQKMYEHLYTELGNGPRDDAEAWNRVRGLLTEAYLPRAQRVALFRAAAAIPGVTTVRHAVDAAGRTGIAAARTDPVAGRRDEFIFDPKTYLYLGERSVVTDAAKAEAPVGTVLTSSAQLSVSVADHAPAVKGD